MNRQDRRAEAREEGSREKQIEEMADLLENAKMDARATIGSMNHGFGIWYASALYTAGCRKQSGWISVEERLPSKSEYLNRHNDGIDTLKRLTIAYMTDTIEYAIGCYDGYKWVNQLGNKKINDVIAWRPFELYEPPKGGNHE